MKITYTDARCVVLVEITPPAPHEVPTGPVPLAVPPWSFTAPEGMEANPFAAFVPDLFPPQDPPPPPPPDGGEGWGEGGGGGGDDQPPPPPPPDDNDIMSLPTPPETPQGSQSPQVDQQSSTTADQFLDQFFPDAILNGQPVEPATAAPVLPPVQEGAQAHASSPPVQHPLRDPPANKTTEPAVAKPSLAAAAPIGEPRKEWKAILANKRVIEGQSKLQVCVANAQDNAEARPVPAALEDQPVDGERVTSLKRQSHVAKRISQYAEDRILQPPVVNRPEYVPPDSPPSSPLTRISAGVASMVAHPDPDLTAAEDVAARHLSSADLHPVTKLEVAQAVRRISPREPFSRGPSDLTDTTDTPKPSSRIKRFSRELANVFRLGKKKRKNKKKEQSRFSEYPYGAPLERRPARPQGRFPDVVRIGQEARMARQSLTQQRNQHLQSAQPATAPLYPHQSSAYWPVTVPKAMTMGPDRYSQFTIVPPRRSTHAYPANYVTSRPAHVAPRTPPRPILRQAESPDTYRSSQVFPVRPLTPDPNCPWGLCSQCLPRDSSLL